MSCKKYVSQKNCTKETTITTKQSEGKERKGKQFSANNNSFKTNQKQREKNAKIDETINERIY